MVHILHNMERPPLDLEMEIEEILAIMAEKNSRALHVLIEILTKNAQGPHILLDMDDMNIRGDQIEIGVAACQGKIKPFVNMVYQRSQWLVDEINKECHKHRACQQGASSERTP
jgi:hypothetical protein